MNKLTIDGVYRDGKIELTEAPAGVKEARVVVTFLPEPSTAPQSQPMHFGQFAGNSMSADEDFTLAEWRGEVELTNGG